jgi:hypothetical protein
MRITQSMAITLTAMGSVVGLCATFALALFSTRHHERRTTESHSR